MTLLSKVSRKVYFFRLADYAEFADKLESVVAHIADLPFNDQGRYQATSGDDTVLAVFVSSVTYPIKIQFARIRRDNLPLVEREGAITPLALEKNEGLMDWSHIVIFADGIVAAEFNQDAPRLRRLGQYLMFKGGSNLPSAPRFMPLFQRNVMEELENFESVTVLELEALTSDADLIAEGDPNIGAAFKACQKAGNVKKSKIVLKSVRSKDDGLKSLARRLFSNPSSRESFARLKVTGRSGEQRKPLDLLEEYLISVEYFARVDSRFKAISTDDAFRVLQKSYYDNKHKFAGAVTANEPWS